MEETPSLWSLRVEVVTLQIHHCGDAGGLGDLACSSTALALGGGKADGDTFPLLSCDSPSASCVVRDDSLTLVEPICACVLFNAICYSRVPCCA